MKILHLDSSILGGGSASRALTAAVVARLRSLDPAAGIVYRDLAASPLPPMTLERLGSDLGQAVLAEFEAARTVVIGAPMYNLGVSSHLKTWIDYIVVAGRTFRYGPEGVEGLAGGKRVIVANARGGLYAPGTPGEGAEFSEAYLRGILAFIGVTSPEFIVAEGLALGEAPREAALDAAHQAIASLDLGTRAAA
ncbi:MAG: NAD(P)H-dependent oxidoreductase [Brevundimonas sp.]